MSTQQERLKQDTLAQREADNRAIEQQRELLGDLLRRTFGVDVTLDDVAWMLANRYDEEASRHWRDLQFYVSNACVDAQSLLEACTYLSAKIEEIKAALARFHRAKQASSRQ